MRKKPSTILLTATMTPPSGMPGSVRNDPGTRRAEYEAAFRYYLQIADSLVDTIVLLENSGADLSNFARIHEVSQSKKKLHLINVSPNYDSSKGKGYGEFLMMDRGLATLEEQRAIQANTPIWKITGRLIVSNLAKLIQKSPAGWHIYCDMRGVPYVGARFAWNEWLELRLIAFTLDGYKASFQGRFADGYVLERNFYHVVKKLIAGKQVAVRPRFNAQPDFLGHSGWTGKSYQGLSHKVKGKVRGLIRQVAPFIWI